MRWTMPIRETLEWMWPVLTPAQLLHDLFRSPRLLQAAGRGIFSEDELRTLAIDGERQHTAHMVWAFNDAPLLDEARAHLGARPKRKDVDEVRTYGHIVIDEAQDLAPMALRMVSRRSLNGSMTVVGDIAQATGSWARDSWKELIEQLPQTKLVEPLTAALTEANVPFGGATRSGLDKQVTIVPVQLVKGLEVDATLVVEPARIVREERQGMRALYVALTRATKRVGILHAEPLPAVLSRSSEV